MEDKQEYMDTKVKPIIENLIYNLICDQPENVENYMLDWLHTTGGYSNKSLTFDEKKELESLRKGVRKKQTVKRNFILEEAPTNEEGDYGDISSLMTTKKTFGKQTSDTGIYDESISPKHHIRSNFKARYVKKTDEQVFRIQNKVLNALIFRCMEDKDFDLIIGALEEKIYDRNEVVIKQGDNGDYMYIVESGVLECFKQAQKGKRMVRKLTSNDTFGELSLLYNVPRAASVITKTNCTLWALDRYSFNNIMKLNVKKKREDYLPFLKSVELLKPLDNYDLLQICDALKYCYFNKGEYIIQEV
jgi:cAMP-dependent protein kinase regulator